MGFGGGLSLDDGHPEIGLGDCAELQLVIKLAVSWFSNTRTQPETGYAAVASFGRAAATNRFLVSTEPSIPQHADLCR
jgi:hypothetical protein